MQHETKPPIELRQKLPDYRMKIRLYIHER